MLACLYLSLSHQPAWRGAPQFLTDRAQTGGLRPSHLVFLSLGFLPVTVLGSVLSAFFHAPHLTVTGSPHNDVVRWATLTLLYSDATEGRKKGVINLLPRSYQRFKACPFNHQIK